MSARGQTWVSHPATPHAVTSTVHGAQVSSSEEALHSWAMVADSNPVLDTHT